MISKYELKQQINPRLAPLAAAIGGVLVAGNLQATTITVTSLLDGTLAGQCTLRSALEAASSQEPVAACPAGSGDDLIVFASELSGDLQLTQGQLSVGEGVTIDGDERITVRGDGSSRVFQLSFTEAPVTFRNITIADGQVVGSGGGIHAAAKTLTLSNVKLVNNTSTYHGGGLFMFSTYGGSLTVENSLISSNTAEGLGSGGGIRFHQSTPAGEIPAEVTLRHNVFEDNKARNGAGVLLDSATSSEEPGYHLIENNVFRNNTAGSENDGLGSGGGLGLTTQLGIFSEVKGNRFEDNQAVNNAGGLFMSTSNAYLADNVFLGNQAGGCGGGGFFAGNNSSIAIVGSVFRDNAAADCGGALTFRGWQDAGAAVAIATSEISNNHADGEAGGGGAILADFGTDSLMIVSNSTISGNTTGYRGGGLKVDGAELTLRVGYSTFAYNHADDRGGGIDAFVPDCGLLNSLFAGNTTIEDGEQEYQELHTPGCLVRDSLVANLKYSDFEADGGVIADVDPMILPLADNGGSNGHTHALHPDSPAIDAGNAGLLVPPFDQRGHPFTRVFGEAVDLGAYEFRVDRIFGDRFE